MTSKSDFIQNLNDRVYRTKNKFIGQAYDDYHKKLQAAQFALNGSPELADLQKRLASLIGESRAKSVINRLDYEPMTDDCELGNLLVKYGASSQALKPEFPELEDAELLLAGAFAYTRIKFWDDLFPPTAEFLRELRLVNDLDELTYAVKKYAEALR